MKIKSRCQTMIDISKKLPHQKPVFTSDFKPTLTLQYQPHCLKDQNLFVHLPSVSCDCCTTLSLHGLAHFGLCTVCLGAARIAKIQDGRHYFDLLYFFFCHMFHLTKMTASHDFLRLTLCGAGLFMFRLFRTHASF